MGGHLAVSETSAENEMLKSMILSREKVEYWIGGYADKNSLWRWISGKPLSDYFDWKDGSPTANSNHRICLSYNDARWDNSNDF